MKLFILDFHLKESISSHPRTFLIEDDLKNEALLRERASIIEACFEVGGLNRNAYLVVGLGGGGGSTGKMLM